MSTGTSFEELPQASQSIVFGGDLLNSSNNVRRHLGQKEIHGETQGREVDRQAQVQQQARGQGKKVVLSSDTVGTFVPQTPFTPTTQGHLIKITDSPWFLEQISGYRSNMNDWEIVCPYPGCDASFRRDKLEKHLNEECPYSCVRDDRVLTYCQTIEENVVSKKEENNSKGLSGTINDDDKTTSLVTSLTKSLTIASKSKKKVGKKTATLSSISSWNSDWEVICPYSFVGCDHTCLRSKLSDHLPICAFRPPTRAEEELQREEAKKRVISAANQERRRGELSQELELTLTGSNGLHRYHSHALAKLLQGQEISFYEDFGNEIFLFLERCDALARARQRHCEFAIESVARAVRYVHTHDSKFQQHDTPSQQQERQDDGQRLQEGNVSRGSKTSPLSSSSTSHLGKDVKDANESIKSDATTTAIDTVGSEKANHDWAIHGFGSRFFGLAVPSSDLDVVVTLRDRQNRTTDQMYGATTTTTANGSENLYQKNNQYRKTTETNTNTSRAETDIDTLTLLARVKTYLQSISTETKQAMRSNDSLKSNRDRKQFPGSKEIAKDQQFSSSSIVKSSVELIAEVPVPRLKFVVNTETHNNVSNKANDSAGPDKTDLSSDLGPDTKSDMVSDPATRYTTLLPPTLTVDVTLDNPRFHSGLATSSFALALLRAVPQLRPITVILKHYLVGLGLADPFKGGISSYGLLLLTASALLRHARKQAAASSLLLKEESDVVSKDGKRAVIGKEGNKNQNVVTTSRIILPSAQKKMIKNRLNQKTKLNWRNEKENNIDNNQKEVKQGSNKGVKQGSKELEGNSYRTRLTQAAAQSVALLARQSTSFLQSPDNLSWLEMSRSHNRDPSLNHEKRTSSTVLLSSERPSHCIAGTKNNCDGRECQEEEEGRNVFGIVKSIQKTQRTDSEKLRGAHAANQVIYNYARAQATTTIAKQIMHHRKKSSETNMGGKDKGNEKEKRERVGKVEEGIEKKNKNLSISDEATEDDEIGNRLRRTSSGGVAGPLPRTSPPQVSTQRKHFTAVNSEENSFTKPSSKPSCSDTSRKGKREKSRIGRLFIVVLHFISSDLNPSQMCVSLVDGGRLLTRKSLQSDDEVMSNDHQSASSYSVRRRQRLTARKRWPKGDPLVIIDPLDVNNNVGKNCWQIQRIQRAFADLEMTISRLIVNTGRRKKNTINSTVQTSSSAPSSSMSESDHLPEMEAFRILNALYRT
eukprot:g3938.t1